MDVSKLESLSTETLQAMRDGCIAVLKKRSAGALYNGRIAWFLDSKGNKRYIRIKRINPKSISGQEVNPDNYAELPMRWKVSPHSLNPVVDKGYELKTMARTRAEEEAKAQRLAENDKPVAAYGDDAW